MSTAELDVALQDLERLTDLVENRPTREANIELQECIKRVQRFLDGPLSNDPPTADASPLVSAGPFTFRCSETEHPHLSSDNDSAASAESVPEDLDGEWVLEGPCQAGLGRQYHSSLSSLAESMKQINPSTEGFGLLSRLLSTELKLCNEVVQSLEPRSQTSKLTGYGDCELSSYFSKLSELRNELDMKVNPGASLSLRRAIENELCLLEVLVPQQRKSSAPFSDR
jgi:hypothetical protein